jgi:PAS domain S-box-containing protein
MAAEIVLTWMSIATATFAAFRYIYRPCRDGVRWMRREWSSHQTRMAKVDEMHEALGPNGGRSLGDLIRKTYGMTQVTDARIDLLMDLNDCALFEAGPDGRNVRVNDGFTRAFGWTASEMVEHRWVRIIHPDDRERYQEEWDASVLEMRSFRLRARYLTRADGVVHVEVFAEPRFDEATNCVVRWLGRIQVLALEKAGAA